VNYNNSVKEHLTGVAWAGMDYNSGVKEYDGPWKADVVELNELLGVFQLEMAM